VLRYVMPSALKFPLYSEHTRDSSAMLLAWRER